MSNGQKGVSCSSCEFEIMFVTSLIFFLPISNWWPVLQGLDSLGAGGQNLALISRSSPLALQFLVQQRHFFSRIEKVPVGPSSDSSCTSHPISGLVGL